MTDRETETPKRLPHLTLNGPTGAIRLNAPELGATVLLLVPNAAVDRAQSYIAGLEGRLTDLKDWGGRALLVSDDQRVESRVPSAVADADAWERLAAGSGALIIADRWGIVYFAKHTTTFDDLPSADEVIEWVRYLGTQCPECGVIDEPGHGEWEIVARHGR